MNDEKRFQIIHLGNAYDFVVKDHQTNRTYGTFQGDEKSMEDMLNNLYKENQELKKENKELKFQLEECRTNKLFSRRELEKENKELKAENEQLKKELKVYHKVARCSNCKYHNYDWDIDDGYGGEEYEVCDKGNDVTEGICEEWEEL